MALPLSHRHILLIVSGGIAAYKTPDIVRLLMKQGASVQCVLTTSAAQFVSPLVLSVLSGSAPLTEMFSSSEQPQVDHIKTVRDADLVLVAPATANLIAKMAHGIADDMASTCLLACNKPLFIAPAMNSSMWEHPATQENLKTLGNRNVSFIGPDAGSLACGEHGVGRMSEPETIVSLILSHFSAAQPLQGFTALVTSGPTYEPIDPVRFIGNRSSGKQGHAIAAALAEKGANVTLISGPTALPDPNGVQTIHIETADEMLAACNSIKSIDIAICAAAVADWKAESSSPVKIKKQSSAPQISLTENPDILASLSQRTTNRPKLVVGFAAETDDVIENAKNKFAKKKCDWILANQVGKNQGFGKDENTVTLLRQSRNGQTESKEWPCLTKKKVAEKLAEEICKELLPNKERK